MKTDIEVDPTSDPPPLRALALAAIDDAFVEQIKQLVKGMLVNIVSNGEKNGRLETEHFQCGFDELLTVHAAAKAAIEKIKF